jgi:DNA modification methylase
MTDSRLTAYLKTARERQHAFYARQAFRFAAQAGDTAAMEEAMALGAVDYQPEPNVYSRYIPGEEKMLDQIITGDARELAKDIPDSSVDMIFTDPVYENVEDYAWLAETAARVLKPEKACLVWCSSVKQYEVQPLMRKHLTFVLQLTYTKVAKAYKVWGYKTFLWTTPCLWFQKDGDHFHADHEWLIDSVLDYGNAITSTATPPAKTHKWHKNPEAYSYWLQRFTRPGDVVWDPFTGSGSLPLVCLEHGRHFIASEIVPEIADQARARIAQVQSQTRMPLIEQYAMELT